MMSMIATCAVEFDLDPWRLQLHAGRQVVPGALGVGESSALSWAVEMEMEIETGAEPSTARSGRRAVARREWWWRL